MTDLIAEARKWADEAVFSDDDYLGQIAHLEDAVDLVKRLADALTARLDRDAVARCVQQGFLDRLTWEQTADAILAKLQPAPGGTEEPSLGRPQAVEPTEPGQDLRDIAMMLKRLCSIIKSEARDPSSHFQQAVALSEKAIDLLVRKGLQGSPFREEGLARPLLAPEEVAGATCHADRDGDCRWPNCPQHRDGEPEKTTRHCPLDVEPDDE